MSIYVQGKGVFSLRKEDDQDGEEVRETLYLSAGSIMIEQVGGHDRRMGPQLDYEATGVMEDSSGNQYEARWEIYEYPIGTIEVERGPLLDCDADYEGGINFYARQ